MTYESNLREVTKSAPCPICTKPDWCTRSEDGVLVVCMREEKGSRRPMKGGPPGWVHVLSQGTSFVPRRHQIIALRPPASTQDWEVMAKGFAQALDDACAQRWADLLK